MPTRFRGQTAVAHRAPPLLLLVVLAALCLLGAGCSTFGLGQLGNYKFTVEMPTERPSIRANFSFLVGMDATLIVESTRKGGGFVKAVSSDPKVVEVLSHDRSRVSVHAAKSGNATLWVTGLNGVSDYVELRVRPAAKVVLGAPALVARPFAAPSERLVAVPLGERLRLDVRVEDATGEVLVAPAGMPVRVSPPERGRVVPPFFADTVDLVFESPGRATLEVDVGPPLDVDVVRPEDVESLGVIDVVGALPGTHARGLMILVPVVTVHGVREPLLSADVELRVRTPDVCAKAELPASLAREKEPRPGVHVIVSKPGNCEIDLLALGRTTTYAASFAPEPR